MAAGNPARALVGLRGCVRGGFTLYSENGLFAKGYFMTRIGRVGVLGAVSVWLAFGAAAADLSKFSEAERQQINDWMAKRAELMTEAGRLDREVGAAWTNEAYTSAEIDALRKHYRELQDELLRAQRAIQEKVLELPAVQAKTNAVAVARAGASELSKKIAGKIGD